MATPGHTNSAPQAARTFIPLWGWTASYCPYFPAHTKHRGISVSVQVRRTTVAPWSFRKAASSHRGGSERGHSVSLPRPTYPLESSSGSAGTFQRGHPALLITGCIRLLQHSHTAGQMKLAELFKYNNSAANRQQPARFADFFYHKGQCEIAHVLPSVPGRVPGGVYRVRGLPCALGCWADTQSQKAARSRIRHRFRKQRPGGLESGKS